jgi:AcrR family transcriptional regulator
MASRPATTKGAATRERILVAAVARFADQGLRLTSVTQIARDAGVTAPAVHAHFGTKDDLFSAAFEYDVAGMVGALRSLMSHGTAAPPGAGALPLVAGYMVTHPLVRRVFQGQEPDRTAALLETPSVAALRAELTAAVGGAQRSGSLRADIEADALYGALETLTLALLLGLVQMGPIGDAARQAAIAAIINTGVRTVAAPGPS